MDEDKHSKLGDVHEWLRLVFLFLYSAIIFYAIKLITAIVFLVQFISTMVVGERNQKLVKFGGQLSVYSYQIICYLTYHSDEKPFPFGDWPDAELDAPLQVSLDDLEADAKAEAEAKAKAEAPPPPVRKKAKRKKKVAKKAAAEKSASEPQEPEESSEMPDSAPGTDTEPKKD